MGDIGDMGGGRSKPPDCAHQERARESCTGSRAVVSSPGDGRTVVGQKSPHFLFWLQKRGMRAL